MPMNGRAIGANHYEAAMATVVLDYILFV